MRWPELFITNFQIGQVFFSLLQIDFQQLALLDNIYKFLIFYNHYIAFYYILLLVETKKKYMLIIMSALYLFCEELTFILGYGKKSK